MQKIQAAAYSGHVVPVPIEDIRGFVANCLRGLGYENIQTPRRIRKITGMLRDSLEGSIKWRFSYAVRITYQQGPDGGTVLDYELSEKNYNWGPSYCQQPLTALVRTIDQDALEYAELRQAEHPSTVHGTARFATEDELLQAGYVTEDIAPDRLVIAPYPGDRYLTIPKAQTAWHALICGPTGAGKSSGFFIPNIVKRHNSSCIVTEATAGDEVPELYEATAGWRYFKGSRIYYFNPGHCQGTRINPLDKLKTVPADEFTAVAEELAQLVILNTTPPTTQRADPIWDKAEKHLLWILIMHAAASGDPELAHFGAIRQMVRRQEKAIHSALEGSKSQMAAQEFASFLAHSSENFRHGVFAGLLQRLNPWLTDRVVTMTRTTDLNLAALRQQLFTFYLSVPSRKAHLKPIAALIFNFLLDLAMEAAFDYPLALILDEFTNYGAIPGIDDALSIIRKRKLPVVLGVQSFKQIETIYGRDIASKIISQLATRVFFRQRHRQTAQEISLELGTKTVVHEDTSDGGITTVREYAQPLMSVADLTTLPEDQVVVMTPTTRQVQIARFTYESFPAPRQFDPPALPEHRFARSSDFLPQAEAVEQAEAAKSSASVSEAERDFIKHTEVQHKQLEEELKKKRGIQQDESWNIPG